MSTAASSDRSDPPPATVTVACQACHRAKVKCKGGTPCERCTKLAIAPYCVPHVSRQGKRRRTLDRHASGDQSEDAWVLQQLGVEQQGHYGLRFLIHSWISFALRRRSFSLLSRATKLAGQLDISMDEVLTEKREMDFVPSIVLKPASEQKVCPETELSWDEIPERLLAVTGSSSSAIAKRDNRWIWIREMHRGMSRYLVSEAFARDIAPLSLLTETWKQNAGPVVDHFLVARCKHTQAFAHQIQRFETESQQPECTRVSQVELKTRMGERVQVDQVACLDIVDINRSYYFIEYVNLSTTYGKSMTLEASSAQDDVYVDLDQLLGTEGDPELQMFLDLMEDDMSTT